MAGVVVVVAILYTLGYVTWRAFNPGNDVVGTV
jgi:hypothetical protein